MGNQIAGRILEKIDRGTYTRKNGEQGRKVEIWLSPFVFDRYTGQPRYNEKEDEAISITFHNNMADAIDKFAVGSDILVTYELWGRIYTNKETSERSCYNTLQAQNVQPYPNQ